jgi:hypothetical protein
MIISLAKETASASSVLIPLNDVSYHINEIAETLPVL